MKNRLKLTFLSIILFIPATFGYAQDQPTVPRSMLEEQLTVACRKSDLEAVKKLLGLGVSANTRDRFDQPAILLAVRSLWEKEKSAAKLSNF